MSVNKQSGFTLIELILFLALAGLFFATAVRGISARSGHAQFTDSIRTATAFSQSLLGNVYNGVLDYGNATDPLGTCNNSGEPGTSGDCIYLGVMVEYQLNSNEYRVHQLIGDRLKPAVLATYASEPAQIFASKPRIISTTTEKLRWGVKFIGGNNTTNSPSNSGKQVNTFAYMRSPSSGRLVPFSVCNNEIKVVANCKFYPNYPLDENNDAMVAKYFDPSEGWSINDNVQFSPAFCFEDVNGKTRAMITAGWHERAAAIEAYFDDVADTRCGWPEY